jgi:hypothetical protein
MASGEPNFTCSRDDGSTMSPFVGTHRSDHANPMEVSGNMDLSMLMGSLPTDDPMNWVYWNELTHEYQVPGVDGNGGNAFYMV